VRHCQAIVQSSVGVLASGWDGLVQAGALQDVPSQEVRAIIMARKTPVGQAIDIELSMRGILRWFGKKVSAVTRKSF
jgi:transposase